MALRSFKDLVVWQKAESLSLSIYGEFASCTDYGFKDQIQRASLSIMNNVAEGYGRRSDRALINFLTIARGSAAEVESMLLIAVRLGHISESVQMKLLAQTEDTVKLVTAFINSLRSSD